MRGANINYQDQVNNRLHNSYGRATLLFTHQSQCGYTALYWASCTGQVEMVQLLLQHKADVNICDEVHACIGLASYNADYYCIVYYA